MLHAIVVGIDRHADARISPLTCARRDAEAVATALEEHVSGPKELTVLVDERATKATIARLLTEELPRRAAVDDVVLLYFAGYGCPDVDPPTGDPSSHLVLHDTQYADLFATAIDVVSELSAWLRRLPAHRVAVLLDASFNGAPSGRTFEGPGLWSGPRRRSLDRVSCARLAHGQRCAVLAAALDKEAAREEGRLGHGVFTHHLLGALRAPPRTPGPLTLARLHASVAESMWEGARSGLHEAQTPALHGGTALGSPLFEWAGRTPPPRACAVVGTGL